ncbi:MAG: hypothetical protein RIM99_18930 [Cyclobacteriaceae bacterium]
MKSIKINKSFQIVLFTSLIVYAFRSLQFWLIGSYVPGALLLAFAVLIIVGIRWGKRWTKSVVKSWAVLMILFGVLRYGLVAMLYFGHIDEVHILEQFTFMFNLVNVLSVIGGAYLIRGTNRDLIFG